MDSDEVSLIFQFGNATKTLRSQISMMSTFAVTSKYHTNAIRQPIYVDGYIFIFTMADTTLEYGFIQTFPILYFELFWLMFYVTEVLEYLLHGGSSLLRLQ